MIGRTSRRNFLMGCSAAIAGMAGSRLGWMAMGDSHTAVNNDVIVMVFLRGGMDGLNFMPPIDGSDRGYYEGFRPNLRVPTSGESAALPLNGSFGLHPAASPLWELFLENKLAIIQAVGSAGSRSHFDAMEFMELGTPGIKTTGNGWLTRHLESAPGIPDSVLVPSLAAGSSTPTSLAGSTETITASGSGGLSLSNVGHWTWRNGLQRVALRALYESGNTPIHEAGIQALNATDIVETYVGEDHRPSNGAVYPRNRFSENLSSIAQMIRLDVGLRIATVDLGGWDTHNDQGTGSGGYFANLVGTLSQGLAAFYQDLNDSHSNAPINRVTVVVQSEFGRRVRENGDRGTDHGTGNLMMVLGGRANGGVYGDWPGLNAMQLYDNADLAPTTDYRQVLSEVLIRRLGNPRIGHVFPGYADYASMGFIEGPSLTPDYTTPPPDVPSGLTAHFLADDLVQLSWQPANLATEYVIERKSGADGFWSVLTLIGPGVTSYEDREVTDTGDFYYRIKSAHSAGESDFTEEVAALNLTGIERWRMIHFGTADNSGDAADDRVLANDGLNNLAKYALDLNPRQVTQTETTGFTPGRPRLQVEGDQLSLVYLRPMDRDDIDYQIRVSDDLREWSLVEDETDGQEGSRERRKATVPVEGSHRFLELHVVKRDAVEGDGS